MATRYLIGRGELLTYRIEAPKKAPNDKVHPYTLAEAKEIIIPEIELASAEFDRLPASACADDIAVASVVLHPAYIAKSYFPKHLLDQAGLASVGSRTRRIRPRRVTRAKAPEEADTTELFVAGSRKSLRDFAKFARELHEYIPASAEFTRIESFASLTALDRVRSDQRGAINVFEVALHLLPNSPPERLRQQFAAYAEECGFTINAEFTFQAGRLMFVAVEGDATRLERLAQFTLIRVVRPMPQLRGARPIIRSTPLAVKFRLPTGEPLSREPKVAILDGGLPEAHVLSDYVRRYYLADEEAEDVEELVAHGLGVTSAFLFGAIEPDEQAPRPYAMVDHHRVLDARSEDEDPYDLYRTLGHVETVLLSRQYQFINLSLGPDLAISDDEVHAWTAVIDNVLSDGETLMTVAVGNNGELDEEEQLNRIQVPADCVNVLSVGASNHSASNWKRASYSAKGPGRSPGRRKPDVLAFGGSPKEYFHVAAPGNRPTLATAFGTSYAAPAALRSAVGIRSILGSGVHPLTIKALLIHGCETNAVLDGNEIGWGRVPNDINGLITCVDGEARIIYQGELSAGKYLRAPLPLPIGELQGTVSLKATFCYASPVDPQDSGAYTKAGLAITFRPHSGKVKPKAANANSYSFFPSTEFRTEAEQRSDLGKWETVLHAAHNFRGGSLLDPVFDVHYNARDAGGGASGAQKIPYALVITVKAPNHPDLHQDILRAHAVLESLEPQVTLPIRV